MRTRQPLPPPLPSTAKRITAVVDASCSQRAAAHTERAPCSSPSFPRVSCALSTNSFSNPSLRPTRRHTPRMSGKGLGHGISAPAAESGVAPPVTMRELELLIGRLARAETRILALEDHVERNSCLLGQLTDQIDIQARELVRTNERNNYERNRITALEDQVHQEQQRLELLESELRQTNEINNYKGAREFQRVWQTIDEILDDMRENVESTYRLATTPARRTRAWSLTERLQPPAIEETTSPAPSPHEWQWRKNWGPTTSPAPSQFGPPRMALVADTCIRPRVEADKRRSNAPAAPAASSAPVAQAAASVPSSSAGSVAIRPRRDSDTDSFHSLISSSLTTFSAY